MSISHHPRAPTPAHAALLDEHLSFRSFSFLLTALSIPPSSPPEAAILRQARSKLSQPSKLPPFPPEQTACPDSRRRCLVRPPNSSSTFRVFGFCSIPSASISSVIRPDRRPSITARYALVLTTRAADCPSRDPSLSRIEHRALGFPPVRAPEQSKRMSHQFLLSVPVSCLVSLLDGVDVDAAFLPFSPD